MTSVIEDKSFPSWFFVFFVYLYGDVLLKERRAEAEVELLEAPERLNWTELKPVFLLVAIVLPLLLYNLSFYIQIQSPSADSGSG